MQGLTVHRFGISDAREEKYMALCLPAIFLCPDQEFWLLLCLLSNQLRTDSGFYSHFTEFCSGLLFILIPKWGIVCAAMGITIGFFQTILFVFETIFIITECNPLTGITFLL